MEGPQAALKGTKRLFVSLALFSLFVNVLMLTGPLYMLQVYDRVLSSRSTATLVSLTLLIAGLYGIMGILDYARGRIAARVGALIQTRLDPRVFEAGLSRAVVSGERGRPWSGLRDLEAVQRFMASPETTARESPASNTLGSSRVWISAPTRAAMRPRA